MKIRYSLAFLFLLLLNVSCPDQIEDGQRAVIKGKVTDFNGAPIPDLIVLSQTFDFDLGETITDDNGQFEFVSLLSTENEIFLVINPNGRNAEFTTLNINFSEREDRFGYDAGNVELARPATLNLTIANASNSNETLNWSLTYIKNYCDDFFFYENFGENRECYDENTVGGSISLDRPVFEDIFPSILNTTAVFRYQIGDEDEETVTLTLNQNETDYEFSY